MRIHGKKKLYDAIKKVMKDYTFVAFNRDEDIVDTGLPPRLLNVLLDEEDADEELIEWLMGHCYLDEDDTSMVEDTDLHCIGCDYVTAKPFDDFCNNCGPIAHWNLCVQQNARKTVEDLINTSHPPSTCRNCPGQQRKPFNDYCDNCGPSNNWAGLKMELMGRVWSRT